MRPFATNPRIPASSCCFSVNPLFGRLPIGLVSCTADASPAARLELSGAGAEALVTGTIVDRAGLGGERQIELLKLLFPLLLSRFFLGLRVQP
jgi:hypothetical protein